MDSQQHPSSQLTVAAAERSLEIALCQYSNGQLETLAWAAAGMPDSGIDHRLVRRYQAARGIVHANGGCLKPGDTDKLLNHWRGME
jgi:hypothetical protein